MDLSSVTALPVTIPSRPGTGAPGAVQAASAVVSSVSVQFVSVPTKETGYSSPPPANSDTSAVLESRDAPSTNSLAQAVKQVNESFSQKGQSLYASFEKDKLTGINVVKIVDKKTNETISQMPPKEMLAFAQFLEQPQGMRGKLINATA